MKQLNEILTEMKSKPLSKNYETSKGKECEKDLAQSQAQTEERSLFLTTFLLALEMQFQLIYGESTKCKLHGDNFETWLDILSDLSALQLEHGIERLTKRANKFMDFPPNPLQFRALCLDTDQKTKIRPLSGDYLPKVPLWLGVDAKYALCSSNAPNEDGSDIGTQAVNKLCREWGIRKFAHREIPPPDE